MYGQSIVRNPLISLRLGVDGMITEGGHFGYNLPVVIISAISRILG